MAVMAASGQDEATGPDGETFIEKYTRGVSAVETILTLDRLRQSVAIKELINAKSKHLLASSSAMGQNSSNNNGNRPFMRKTVSVPNISHVSTHIVQCNNLCSDVSISQYSQRKQQLYDRIWQ